MDGGNEEEEGQENGGCGRGEGEARHLRYKWCGGSYNVFFGSGAFPAAFFTHLLRQRLLSLAGQPPHLVSRNKAFVSFGHRAPLLLLLLLLPSSSFFLGSISFVKPSPSPATPLRFLPPATPFKSLLDTP